MAADRAGRQARRLPVARRGQDVETAGPGTAEVAGVVDGQATADNRDPTGIYFGTTSGEVWASRDEGRSFRCVARHLPHIYAVEVGAG